MDQGRMGRPAHIWSFSHADIASLCGAAQKTIPMGVWHVSYESMAETCQNDWAGSIRNHVVKTGSERTLYMDDLISVMRFVSAYSSEESREYLVEALCRTGRFARASQGKIVRKELIADDLLSAAACLLASGKHKVRWDICYGLMRNGGYQRGYGKGSPKTTKPLTKHPIMKEQG